MSKRKVIGALRIGYVGCIEGEDELKAYGVGKQGASLESLSA